MEEETNEKKRRRTAASLRYNPHLVPPEVSTDVRNGGADASLEIPVFLQHLLTTTPRTFRMNHVDYSCFFVGGAWDDPSDAQYVLVRERYESLFDFVSGLQSKREGGIRGPGRAVVSGTAGVGKSLFGLYAARRWFDAGKLVVLWFGETFWVFSKEKNEKKKTPALGEYVVCDRTIYYAAGKPTMSNNASLLLDTLQKRLDVVIIRDPGVTKQVSLMLMQAFALYNVSSGNKEFMWQLGKISVPPVSFLRYMDPWSGPELLVGLQSGCFPTVPQGEQGTHFVLEGYRRYGGSARNVINFAERCVEEEVAKENVGDLQDDETLTEAVVSMAEKQTMGAHEEAKAKALIYHRMPQRDGKGYRIHFASPYIARKVIDRASLCESRDLAIMVAALGAGGDRQDAYGVLFENEMHKILAVGNSFKATARCLGCYEPNAKKIQDREVKKKVDLFFGDRNVLMFPGHSLENFAFEDKSELANVYILPITPTFPTHDAFVLMKAVTFFDRKESAQSIVDNAWVLVGLQMAVSGSGDASHKPSHVIRGEHLHGHLVAMQGAVGAVDSSAMIIDIVTVFISPTESCRKTKFTPVTSKEGKPILNAIGGFEGMAPQYYVVQEDTYIAGILGK